MKIRVGTVPVVIKNVCCVMSLEEAWRTLFHAASALLVATCFQILEGAAGVLALEFLSRRFQNPTNRSFVIVARSYRVTACVSV